MITSKTILYFEVVGAYTESSGLQNHYTNPQTIRKLIRENAHVAIDVRLLFGDDHQVYTHISAHRLKNYMVLVGDKVVKA
jgi:hypothetical protein